MMKLISWNVNGIRAVMNKGFVEYINKEDPDIFCLQEIKIDKPHDILELHDKYPFRYWNCAHKKGYSGTAIFSKIKPLNVYYGLDLEHHDKEGRMITLEFEKFFLITVYTPNAQHGLLRLDYRLDWDLEFLSFCKKLEKKKPVVFCGDLNVAHTEIDLANPASNRKNPGFTDEERASFDKIVDSGFIDSFRVFHKDGGHYTWWSYMFNARAKNVGWRIDYFCISSILKSKLEDAFIREKVLGSDHCPVGIILKT